MTLLGLYIDYFEFEFKEIDCEILFLKTIVNLFENDFYEFLSHFQMFYDLSHRLNFGSG
jgi:hypothetical protein